MILKKGLNPCDNMTQVTICLLIGLIFFFIISIFAGELIFKKMFKRNFSFFKEFPYELYSPFGKNKNLIYLISSVIYIGISITAFIPYISLADGVFSTMIYFIMIAGIYAVTQLFYLSLILIPAFFIKVHSALATLFFSFSLLGSTALGLSLINIYSITMQSPVLIIAILCFILSLAEFLIIFNPKLKTWTELEKHPSDSGELTYARPKIFALAVSEWSIVIIQFIIAFLALITYLIVYMR
ncbi:MAG: hypothetical protein WC366_00905 [Bacilli bacterium]